MELPVLMLTGVVILEAIWIGWIHWRCCGKAHQAWRGVDYLHDWLEQELKPSLTAQFEACGCEADPTWPPQGPGDFPSSVS